MTEPEPSKPNPRRRWLEDRPEVSPYVVAAPAWLIVANTSNSGLVATVAGIAAIACSLADVMPLAVSVVRARGGNR
jgi:hypothetical protein